MKKLSHSVIITFAGLDVLFVSLVTLALIRLLGVAHSWAFAGLLAALTPLKILGHAAYAHVQLTRYEVYAETQNYEQRRSSAVEADQCLQRFPMRFSLVYDATWFMIMAAAYLIGLYAPGDYFKMPDHTGLPMVFVLLAVTIGGNALVFPLAVLFTTKPAGKLSVFARQASLILPRRMVSLHSRITGMALCLGFAPMLWVVAVGYVAQANAVRAAAAMAGQVDLGLAVTTGNSFLLSVGAFALTVGAWAPICAMALSRAVSQPIEALAASAREVVEEGNQTSMGVLPVIRRDEVGMLTERFNDLLDMMRDLSRGADLIARGNLDVNLDRPGELPDAFRRMATSLQEVVRQIRQTSVDLAAAATEILAASQEQEAAATSQSSAMTEISHTMESLSRSAAHVSESVSGVLANAEQTLVTTDSMVQRIDSLSTHTGRISELLDTIRDIADKSDLLALNGSLEASRAGEGGQGFALVAAEMRRLAVRVTASTEDVKKLVVDIREASTATIMATEESRRLARETTEAARQITLVSQQQRTGTEQVSQSVREVAGVVTQAAAATSETRTSAQGLKRQADELSKLVKRFDYAAGA
jgi:methyl-accepting chemotaxis protein